MYARTVSGEELSFGVSGMLWRDNLVMYDRQSESWWAQADGRAIHGPKKGAVLEQVPSDMMTWTQWRALHPHTRVLAADPTRAGRDAYARYHSGKDVGVTGRTRTGGALEPKRLVVGFRQGRGAFAVPLDDIAGAGVMQIAAEGRDIVLVAVADGSTARAFLAGSHTFEPAGERDGRRLLRDTATGSSWDGFDGVALSGALRGKRLEPLTAHVSYWFSWFSFFPDATVLRAPLPAAR